MGITVNAISPAAATRMNRELLAQSDNGSSLDLDPLHVARVVAWLASDEAEDVTGRVIHAGAGQHREYLVRRTRDAEVVRRLDDAVERMGW